MKRKIELLEGKKNLFESRTYIKVREDKGIDPSLVEKVKKYVAMCRKNGVPLFSADYPGAKGVMSRYGIDEFRVSSNGLGSYDLHHDLGIVTIRQS